VVKDNGEDSFKVLCSKRLNNSPKKLSDRERNKGAEEETRTKSIFLAFPRSVFNTRQQFFHHVTMIFCMPINHKNVVWSLQIHTRVAKLKQQVRNKWCQMWQQSSAPTGDVTMFFDGHQGRSQHSPPLMWAKKRMPTRWKNPPLERQALASEAIERCGKCNGSTWNIDWLSYHPQQGYRDTYESTSTTRWDRDDRAW
jgi:hypothetical protein